VDEPRKWRRVARALVQEWMRNNLTDAAAAAALTFYGILALFPSILFTQTIRSILPGSIAGVLVWLAATLAFSFYVSHFGNFGITYGAWGAIVVLLLWMWLSSLALMLGAEINAVLRPHVTAQ
jgi:membrane protein